MSSYLKPQSPLYHKAEDTYFYPLTTADQVIMEDGSRLNTKITTPKAGFIYPLASSVVPEGFLLCNGAEYLRSEYPELFAAIGTIYGSGDGSTTFNVPNLQTRVPVGSGENYNLGDVGGEAEHTLATSEIPNVTGQLQFRLVSDSNLVAAYPDASQDGCFTFTKNGGAKWSAQISTVSSATNNTDLITFDNGGQNQPHNNMQPYTVVNYIIATGKNTGVSVQDIVAGAQALPLGVEYGGTGATDAAQARENLGITPANIGALGAIESTDYPGCFYRIADDGATEWINPPLHNDVEYRTTERYGNNPIYVKAIWFGNLPSSNYKAVSISGIDYSKIIYVIPRIRSSVAVKHMPYVSVSAGSAIADFYINAYNIVLNVNSDMSDHTGLFLIKYYK